jgi:ABC-2 type transport system permease protein
MSRTVVRALRGAWNLARVDLALWRRSPTAIAAALIPPIGMAVLLYVLTLSVGRQPVALVVESHGRYARHIEGIIRSEADAYAITTTGRAGAQHLLDTQQAVAAIVIPRNFDTAVSECHSLRPGEASHDERYGPSGCPKAKLQFTLNNIDRDFSDDVRRLVARSAARFDAPDVVIPASEGQLDMSELNPYRVSVTTHQLRRTTVDYLKYSVIPTLVLLALTVGVMGTALLCAGDVERGTARYLALAPLPPSALVAGRMLGGVLATTVVMVPTLVIATTTGLISPPPGHWPALVALFLATALCAAGLGAALGATLRGARQVAVAASVISTYLFFLGGGFTTIQFLPHWLRRITALVPTRYAIDGLRQSLFYPDVHGLMTDLLVLLGTAAVAVIVGAVLVRRSWSE